MKNLKTKKLKLQVDFLKYRQYLRKSFQAIAWLLIGLTSSSAYSKADVPKNSKLFSVTGSVISTNGHLLQGVRVSVKGGDITTVTNQDGNFSIKASTTATLIFTYEKYISTE